MVACGDPTSPAVFEQDGVVVRHSLESDSVMAGAVLMSRLEITNETPQPITIYVGGCIADYVVHQSGTVLPLPGTSSDFCPAAVWDVMLVSESAWVLAHGIITTIGDRPLVPGSYSLRVQLTYRRGVIEDLRFYRPKFETEFTVRQGETE